MPAVENDRATWESPGRATIELPPMGNLSPEQAVQKSLTHWVWTPYIDINNMAPWGIKSQLGYRKQTWTEFKRCTPYPLGNLTEEFPDRQAAEEAFQSGFSINSASLPKIEYVKYAQAQANELGESFGDEHGLRILTPLIGIDDFEIVGQIIQTVQPFAYQIHEMAYEFTEGATERIRTSNLSREDKAKATEIARIMLNGSQRALLKANDEYERLISSMSDASVGKPGISNPTPFHHWICEQLDKPVPERINRMQQQQQPIIIQQDNSELNALRQELAELKASLPKKKKEEAA